MIVDFSMRTCQAVAEWTAAGQRRRTNYMWAGTGHSIYHRHLQRPTRATLALTLVEEATCILSDLPQAPWDPIEIRRTGDLLSRSHSERLQQTLWFLLVLMFLVVQGSAWRSPGSWKWWFAQVWDSSPAWTGCTCDAKYEQIGINQEKSTERKSHSLWSIPDPSRITKTYCRVNEDLWID